MNDALHLVSAGIYVKECVELWNELRLPKNHMKWAIPLIGGFVLGDLGSGVIHYSLDTFNSQIFSVVHTNFRIHHDNPSSLEAYSMIESVCEVTPVLIPFVTATRKLIPKLRGMGVNEDTIYMIGLVVLVGTLVGGSTQIAHRFAHRRNHENTRDGSGNRVVAEVPIVVKFIQDNHLMLHPDHHRKHHVTEIAHYCISNGSTGPLFDMFIDLVELPISQFMNRKVDGESTHTYLTHEERRVINDAYDEADSGSRDIGRPYHFVNLLRNCVNPSNDIAEK
jgi:hypothetical protein